ncbi:MAG: hypothetical protein HFG66_18985 [Hungatella sp.]|nr:hypothetical protein [Hungatella sp.]
MGIVLAEALSLVAPPAELTRQSMMCLGIFACAVCLTKTVSYEVTVSGISNRILF